MTKMKENLKRALESGQTLRREAAMVKGYDEKQHQVTLSFASDEPYTRWGDTEILRCNDECMDIHRFDEGVMVALFNHDRDVVIGHPVKIWNDGKKAYALLQFADTDKAKEVENLVASGTLKGVSVGYIVHNYEYIDEKTEKYGYKGPAFVANKWEVLEFSLVSVPADPTVGVGRSHNSDDDKTPPEPENAPKAEPKPVTANVVNGKGENQMDNKDTLLAEAQAKENARCRELDALAAKYGIDNDTRAAWLEDKDMTPEKAMGVCLEKMAAENAALKNVTASKVTVGATQDEKLERAYADAILLRSGMDLTKPADGAEQLRGMSLKAIAADILIRAGEHNVMRMTDGELFERAMGSGQFANIIDLTVKVSAAKAYQEQATTFEKWTNKGSLTDFKMAYRYRVSDAPEPELIPENGEFKQADLTGKTIGVQLDTEGIGWSFTRKAFINDDMDIFNKFPRIFASAFKRKINRLAYTALAGISWTSSGTNKNVGTAGHVSTAALAEARKLLRKVQDENGSPLNFNLAYLLVPTAEEQTALELLTSTANPSGAHSGVNNVFRGAFEVICDPELDVLSETAWYAMANRNQIDGIEISYLNGKAEPTVEAKNLFNTLGRAYRMYLDFGVKALDGKGIVKNAGAN